MNSTNRVGVNVIHIGLILFHPEEPIATLEKTIGLTYINSKQQDAIIAFAEAQSIDWVDVADYKGKIVDYSDSAFPVNIKSDLPLGFSHEQVQEIKLFIRGELESVVDGERTWRGGEYFDVCIDTEDGDESICIYQVMDVEDGNVTPVTDKWCEVTRAEIMADEPLVLAPWPLDEQGETP